jgi:AraC-like DNA-binding protein
MPLPALSIREIAEGARGYCSQRVWLYATLSDTVHAYAIWGVPDAEELGSLFELWDTSFGQMGRHSILADLRGLDVVNPRAFAAFLNYFRTRADSLRAMIDDSCVVISASLAGTVAAGFFGILPAPFPFTTTTDLSVAATRLKLSEENLVEYEAIRKRIQEEDSLSTGLRRLLEEDLLEPDPAILAKRLGLSPRSLQRRLSELGTSFSEQLGAARIARAKSLLEQTNDPMTQIAFAVGFGSLEHFSRSFRARVGTTPSAYREALAAQRSRTPRRK